MIGRGKITTHLWYDKEAKEAAEFYVSVFPNTKVKNVSSISGTPSGDVDIVTMDIVGDEFMLISAGPLFKFNPSISFHVTFKTKEEVDAAWNKLIKGGKALMELGEYPFSARYGWVQDKYGLSWQLILVGGDTAEKITPALLFVGDVCGRAEEAAEFYVSVFKFAKAEAMVRWGKGEEPEKEGTVKYASVILEGKEFGLMDSANEHKFGFNEAISFMVNCETQDEIDYYWEKLSAVPESEQCGWLKDKFGVSWQIVPTAMNEMMAKGTKEQIDRVTKAFLEMKKFNIAELQEAYEG